MKRTTQSTLLFALLTAALSALAGCTAPADPGDDDADNDTAEAEQAVTAEQCYNQYAADVTDCNDGTKYPTITKYNSCMGKANFRLSYCLDEEASQQQPFRPY